MRSDPVKFKHIRDDNGKLCGTMCFCTDQQNDKIVYIGVAICSNEENFSRKRGRDIAYGRACKAYAEERNLFPINVYVTNKNMEVVLAEPLLRKYPYKSIYFDYTKESAI